MPHIHTKPGEHDATVSAFIIRFDTPEPQLLLHLHKKYGRWMQPGGPVELTETPWQAMLHEITEETGYELEQLELLQPAERLRRLSSAKLHPVSACDNTHAIGDGHFHTDRTYVFATTSLPKHEPATGESQSFKWVSLDELAKLPSSETSPQLVEIGAYCLTVCAPTWEHIPLTNFPV